MLFKQASLYNFGYSAKKMRIFFWGGEKEMWSLFLKFVANLLVFGEFFIFKKMIFNAKFILGCSLPYFLP
jgi:hypothetical protein